MREIKFRAYLKLDNGLPRCEPSFCEKKAMVRVNSIHMDEDGVQDITVVDDYFGNGELVDLVYDSYVMKLMPFIGYKDEKGLEIYKKDILQALMVIGNNMDLDKRKNVELKPVYFEVDYIQGAFLLRGININKNILVNHLFMDKDYYKERIKGSAHYKIDSEKDKYYRFDDFKVVGNIYENPEILEAEG